jgi:hypothetical protein
MSKDVKFFNACNHIVDGKQYESAMCPRCYSKGYYLDICFDSAGLAVTSTGSIKLQQEMLKVLMDEKYKNVFHPQWGSEIYLLPGSKNVAISKTKLEVMVRRALEYLKTVQTNEYHQYGNLTPEEILDQIEYIEIKKLGPTGWQLYIMVSNSVSEIYAQTITF